MTKRKRTPQEEEAYFRSMTGLCNIKEDYASFDLIPRFFPNGSDYSVRMDTPKGSIWVMCHFGEPIEFDLLIPEGARCRLFLPRGRVNFFGAWRDSPQLIEIQKERMVFAVPCGGWHMVCEPFRFSAEGEMRSV